MSPRAPVEPRRPYYHHPLRSHPTKIMKWPGGDEEEQPSSSITGMRAYTKEQLLALGANTAEIRIDVFKPDVAEGVVLWTELAPLSMFKNLHTLVITGMVQSYQRIIWEVVWLNSQLEKLVLVMAEEPTVLQPQWAKIQRGGSKGRLTKSEYLGDDGRGRLNKQYGEGEYLDVIAMERGWKRAFRGQRAKGSVEETVEGKVEGKKVEGKKVKGKTVEGKTVEKKMSLRSLTLAGFVVDTTPFARFFEPGILREVHLGPGCIDAGFGLTRLFIYTVFGYRREKEEDETAAPMAIWWGLGEPPHHCTNEALRVTSTSRK